MATMGRSAMSKAKNSLSDAIAQTVISCILTCGFVLISVLAGLGLFIEGMFDKILIWYGPMFAIVVAFYFGVYITKKNGETPETATPPDTVTRILEALVQSATLNTTATANIQNMVSELATSFNALGKLILPIMKSLATAAGKEAEEQEPEVQEDKPPKPEDFI